MSWNSQFKWDCHFKAYYILIEILSLIESERRLGFTELSKSPPITYFISLSQCFRICDVKINTALKKVFKTMCLTNYLIL